MRGEGLLGRVGRMTAALLLLLGHGCCGHLLLMSDVLLMLLRGLLLLVRGELMRVIRHQTTRTGHCAGWDCSLLLQLQLRMLLQLLRLR